MQPIQEQYKSDSGQTVFFLQCRLFELYCYLLMVDVCSHDRVMLHKRIVVHGEQLSWWRTDNELIVVYLQL